VLGTPGGKTQAWDTQDLPRGQQRCGLVVAQVQNRRLEKLGMGTEKETGWEEAGLGISCVLTS
jgi:hypothetical protein